MTPVRDCGVGKVKGEGHILDKGVHCLCKSRCYAYNDVLQLDLTNTHF